MPPMAATPPTAPDPVRIRAMRPEDAEAVARLSAELGYPSRAEEVIRRLGRLARQPGHAVFVAERGGEAVGWAHACGVLRLSTDGYVEIGSIVVDAAHRRAGVGEALVRACEDWGVDAGYARLRLRSGLHRDGAHAFYERLGYARSKASYAFERVLEESAATEAPARKPASAAIAIGPLGADDRVEWEVLARGYKQFYETPLPDAEYDLAWARLLAGSARGLGARVDGRLVGIAHFLFHGSTWAERVCYLQDLFVEPAARGLGAARALIEAVADAARAEGASRYYWLTQRHNAAARLLYDRLAAHRGFIRYDYPLEGPR